MERRTIAGWCHFLNDPGAELTLSEFMAKCLLDIRDNVVLGRLSSEHTEGMLTTLDEMMATTNAAYGALAAKRAEPVNGALTGGRDE